MQFWILPGTGLENAFFHILDDLMISLLWDTKYLKQDQKVNGISEAGLLQTWFCITLFIFSDDSLHVLTLKLIFLRLFKH